MKRPQQSGFTLVEILVAITVALILVGVLAANYFDSLKVSRDAKRQADLRNLQAAIELYKLEYGRYPAGCNGAGVWSGQLGTDFECNHAGTYAGYAGTGQYIVKHDPADSSIQDFAPGFIPVLPVDPRLNGDNSGYVYLANADGTVYKLVAYRTVEEMSVVDGSSDHIDDDLRDFKLCETEHWWTADTSMLCYDDLPCYYTQSYYPISYAVWGGYADMPTAAQVTTYTENIVCSIPN
ncbi:prepilin-type N-terminal cleavage/methylation domain-containing protein [Candidatus Kaiserbacteria bacterium]|nr:prepilin-type N-terminal cleavage/methylation domain-containing protein [Candidatus Kaiserbacteria bacterium]MCB9812655.1 prepilin-type N-terminal cleavage/methylation domain-containing protein [Candidatus Nomurabacteria bacterium]